MPVKVQIKVNVPKILPSQKMQYLPSAFDLSSPEGVVGSSGYASENYLLILTPKFQSLRFKIEFIILFFFF